MGRGAEQEAPCSCSAWGHPLCGRLLHPRLLHTEPPVSWARLRAFSLPSLRTCPPHPRGVLCHPPPPTPASCLAHPRQTRLQAVSPSECPVPPAKGTKREVTPERGGRAEQDAGRGCVLVGAFCLSVALCLPLPLQAWGRSLNSQETWSPRWHVPLGLGPAWAAAGSCVLAAGSAGRGCRPLATAPERLPRTCRWGPSRGVAGGGGTLPGESLACRGRNRLATLC